MNITGEIRYELEPGLQGSAQIKFTENEKEFYVVTVFVPSKFRSGGFGTVLMDRVMLLADILKKDVRLVARPIGVGTSEAVERLINYYLNLDFEIISRESSKAEMVRKPKALPVSGIEPPTTVSSE
ncbi:hypothetical protein KAI87_09885 [Myxococcota bacterium]|nr:hypothetical protein [Myxococcota bacterium]